MENEKTQEEQPITEQANVLNATEDKSADSCEGSSYFDNSGEQIGKFKNAQALFDAYNNLQAEFTKKCQRLSELEKEKTVEQTQEKKDERLNEFLSSNKDALLYKDEFSSFLEKEQNTIGSIDGAWAKFVLSKLSSDQEHYTSEPIVNKYIFQDENVRNKIIENYIKELNHKKPPVIMSKQSGMVVAEQKPATPSTLKEAKKLVEDMFS